MTKVPTTSRAASGSSAAYGTSGTSGPGPVGLLVTGSARQGSRISELHPAGGCTPSFGTTGSTSLDGCAASCSTVLTALPGKSANAHSSGSSVGASTQARSREPLWSTAPNGKTSTRASTGVPGVSSCTSCCVCVWYGRSVVDRAGSSLRCETFSQPFCRYISWPSARTSVSVTCRSVSGAVDDSHRSMDAGPSSVMSLASGVVVQCSAVPGGGDWSQRYLFGGP